MTDEEQQAETKRFRDQAALDLGAIMELRRNGAFQNYWMRRLITRRDAVAKSFRDDPYIVEIDHGNGVKIPVVVCTHEERETRRRILDELDNIVGMLDKDEGETRNSIERTT